MNKELEALKKIKDSYDAFYITNKYGPGTHKEEFDILIKAIKDDGLGLRAINWLKHQYDCYYKDDYSKENKKSAFYYLEELLGGN